MIQDKNNPKIFEWAYCLNKEQRQEKYEKLCDIYDIKQPDWTIDENFAHACDLLLNCQGKVILTGVGKSGHIATKIASTLASTGTQAFFVQACEAAHGDLGMIGEKDVVIAISNIVAVRIGSKFMIRIMSRT